MLEPEHISYSEFCAIFDDESENEDKAYAKLSNIYSRCYYFHNFRMRPLHSFVEFVKVATDMRIGMIDTDPCELSRLFKNCFALAKYSLPKYKILNLEWDPEKKEVQLHMRRGMSGRLLPKSFFEEILDKHQYNTCVAILRVLRSFGYCMHPDYTVGDVRLDSPKYTLEYTAEYTIGDLKADLFLSKHSKKIPETVAYFAYLANFWMSHDRIKLTQETL